MSLRVAVLAGLLAVSPRAAWGQRLSLEATAAVTRVHDPWPVPGALGTGHLLGAAAAAGVGPLDLDLAYAEGTVRLPGSEPWTVADGEAFVGLRPAAWAGVSAGPHIRTYVTPYGRYRRVLWEARLRLDAGLNVPGMWGFLEVRRAVSATLNTGEPLAGPAAGTAGLLLALPATPLMVSLAYAVESGTFGSAPRREVTERLIVGVAFRVSRAEAAGR